MDRTSTALLLALIHATLSVAGELELLGTSYRADEPFPEYFPFWTESWSLKTAAGDTRQYATRDMPTGGSAHMLFRNTGETALEVDDLLLEDVSLTRAITFSKQRRKRELYPASIHFADLPAAERNRLISAGEPVWWRIEPQPVPPGGTAEAFVRLRRAPERKDLRLTLEAADGTMAATVPVRRAPARLAGISFSPQLDRMYAYIRALPQDRQRPTKVILDGEDLTSLTTFGFDPAASVCALVVKLVRPLANGSFHCLRVDYEGAGSTMAGVRAWNGDLMYGIWGYGTTRRGDATYADAAARHVRDWATHNVNVHMGMPAHRLRDFLRSDPGRQLCESLGLRVMSRWVGNLPNPRAYFLLDEPDCGDYRVKGLEPHQRVGSLAQSLVKRSHELRGRDATRPQLLNVNMTFKPDNWYTYGQLPDIFAADPYYQERLCDAYWKHPDRLPLYTKATYVHAVATVCHSACAPRPLHLLLNSVRHTEKDRQFRFGTPEEKRVEAYYALAGGAKGLSYWWYTPIGRCYGCGADDPQAAALWREIGLVGAEARTAGPLIVRSCPAQLPVTASRRLWVRCLLAGLDTVLAICVNDDHASDRVGTVVQPLERAQAMVHLPSWLAPKDAFEITYRGVTDVDHEQTGARVTLRLGQVVLTRLVVITSDTELRTRLSALYDARLAQNVRALLEATPK